MLLLLLFCVHASAAGVARKEVDVEARNVSAGIKQEGVWVGIAKKGDMALLVGLRDVKYATLLRCSLVHGH